MSRQTAVVVAGSVVALLLIALLLGLSDLTELRTRLDDVSWPVVALAAVAGLVSYAAIAGCEHRLLVILGHRVPPWTMVRAITVAVVANRSFRSGGVTGFAVLAWLLGRVGVPPTAVLSAAVGFAMLTNALLALVFVAGLVALLVSAAVGDAPIHRAALAAFVLAAALFVATFVGSVLALVVPRLRDAWMNGVDRVAGLLGRIVRLEAVGAYVHRFLERLTHAAQLLLSHHRSMGVAAAWAAFRIAMSMASLWLCFAAIDTHVSLGVLILGYTAGKMAGMLSFVPAGLGLVEGSMVGVFASFGLPYEAALLASLLNRAVYHLLPALLAVVFFGPLMRQARSEVASAEATRGASADATSGASGVAPGGAPHS